MAVGPEFSFFGYGSEDQIGSEELGDPFEIKTVDLAALVEAASPTDALIVGKNECLYPVMVRGTPIGGIRVMIMEDDGTWEFVSTESKAEVEQALSIISAHSLDREYTFLLDIEELEMVFVGYESGDRTLLIPLFANASSSLVPGTTYEFTGIAAMLKEETIAARNSYESMVPPPASEPGSQNAMALGEPIAPTAETRLSSTADSQTEKRLDIALVPQEQNQWCWAATGRMTMIFAGGDSSKITQCAQANDAFEQSSCCEDGSADSCNKTHRPRYENWGFTAIKVYQPDGASLRWEALRAEINGGKPVAFLWRWKRGGGHYMVAVGYYENLTTTPATKMVYVNNPWPPNEGKQESVTYESWVGGTNFNNLQTCYFYYIMKSERAD
jgi:hypothetical protein